MSSIRLDSLVKSYGKNQVVHGIDLEIEDKEFVVLVGPSGCGKSTVLRMIAGLETITDGKIWIGDKMVNELSPKDRDIAMVFQNYALYPHLTVYENMAFSLKLKKVTKEIIDQKVNEAAEILGLTSYLKRKPSELSGGQRQRVAMGRAIVRKPKVFLFDEPLSNLDAKLRTTMRKEIKELQKKLNTTVVYVTHDQVEAMTLADKIVVMKDGRIEQVGHPLDVYENPVNTFVANFMGNPPMNLIDVDSTFGSYKFDNKDIILGIRPEKFSLISDNTDYEVEANVNLIEPLGGETLVHMNFYGQEFTARLDKNLRNSELNKLKLYFRNEDIHRFSKQTFSANLTRTNL